MARSAAKLAAAFVHAWIAASLMLNLARARCNFAASCKDMELVDGSTLAAACRAMDDSFVASTIDLNERLSNDDGQLLCNEGGSDYTASCTDARLTATTLSASCKNSVAAFVSTSTNLNNCISNNNGRLTWC